MNWNFHVSWIEILKFMNWYFPNSWIDILNIMYIYIKFFYYIELNLNLIENLDTMSYTKFIFFIKIEK